MKALVWDGSELRLVLDAPPPVPRPGWAIVRVLLAGICSTDLQILAGYMGFRGIPGHEFVGFVENGSDRLRGQRVVGEINFGCRRCDRCARGLERHCATRSVLGILGADGAFAELVAIPEANLHVLPEGLDDRRAVFVEPLAAAFRAEEQSRAFGGGRTAILGAGKLGLLIAQVLARRGDQVSVLCRTAETARLVARELDQQAMPAHQATPGFRLVVEATGSADGLALATALADPLGAVVLKTTVAGCHSIDLSGVVINEVTVLGSRCGPFQPAIESLAEGWIRTEMLLAGEMSLADGLEAIRQASLHGARKILLRIGCRDQAD